MISNNAPSSVMTGYATKKESSAIWVMLLIYICVEYIRPQFWVPAISVIRPAFIPTLILAIFSAMNVANPIYKDTSIRSIILFVLLCFFSIPFATNNYWALQNSLSMMAHVFAFVVPLGLAVKTEDRLKKFLLFWVSIHIYLALFGFTHGGKGPGSFLSDENDLALALNVGIPFCYFLRQVSSISRAFRMFMTLSLVVLVAGVVVTFSRGGFVGLVVTIVAIIVVSRNPIRNLILIACASMVFLAVAPSEYKSEMNTISDTKENTAAGRLYQWRRGWEMYLDNPVIGVGPGNYPWRVAYYELASGELAPNGRLHGGRAAHSLYFTLLPELGTAGAIFFLVALVHSSRRLLRVVRVEKQRSKDGDVRLLEAAGRATLVSLIAFLSTGVFISVLYYPPFWYLIGFAYVIDSLSRKSSLAEKVESGRPLDGKQHVSI